MPISRPSPDRRLHCIGMQGLGDNIYQRAFIKTLSREWDIYLETAWPEFYSDLPVRFVKPTDPHASRLRTQAKNVARSRVTWTRRPLRPPQFRRNSYISAFRQGRSIIAGMEDSFGIKLQPDDFGLPELPPPAFKTAKPIAFVRPVTVRREWFNSARNPEPQYLAQIVEALQPTHHIVTVADIDVHNETLVGPPLKADHEFIRGELSAMDMLALLASSDIVIGGVGFIVPASIALKRRCFVVLGGQGGHNAPRMILDERLDCSRIGFATPKDFCQCTNMRHGCNKTIPNLMEQFLTFVGQNCTRPTTEPCSGIPVMASAISP